ncbi:MAG: RagB/SusD family nutrient uptake outer membrane protein [Mucilaginibacter sp.]|uniref:RagB/SusD family nutrient uptake outer membrane protein n=1 Tax=Mucilaginibacter sp. TaxID=1882438 RepID=UPI003264A4E8
MKIRIILIVIALFMISTSCNKVLDVQSTRLVNEDNMWLKAADAQAGVIGVFGLSRAALNDNDRHWIYGDLRTIQGRGGDFRSVTRLDLKAVSSNQLKATYPLLDALSNWTKFYAAINAANIFLERAPNILKTDPTYLPSDLKLDIANVRAIRAFIYFYMVRIWGDVPLIITSHDGQFDHKPRETQKNVLTFVESELLAVIPDVPVVYNSDPLQPEQPRKGATFFTFYIDWQPIKKHAAYAILAHVYAWEGKYADAAICAKWVLDNMQLGAMTAIKQGMNFLNIDQMRQMFRGESGNNQYNIVFGFSHNLVNGESTTTGALEELTLAAPYITNKALPAIYVPKDSILSVFKEANDVRFSIDPILNQPSSDRYFGAFDRTFPIFTKVFIITNHDPPLNTLNGVGSNGSIAAFGSATVFTRPDDMELLLAEADAVLGNTADAITLLNAARANRGLLAYDATKNGTLIDAIFDERRRELMGEGHRWYDLIRYKKIKNNDPVFNTMIQNGAIYWPIAQSVLSENPLLVQNPYWN